MAVRINHKWNKDNTCIKCRVYREKETVKTLMAIDRGRDFYKYEVKYKYTLADGTETDNRPNCWLTTYDD